MLAEPPKSSLSFAQHTPTAHRTPRHLPSSGCLGVLFCPLVSKAVPRQSAELRAHRSRQAQAAYRMDPSAARFRHWIAGGAESRLRPVETLAAGRFSHPAGSGFSKGRMALPPLPDLSRAARFRASRERAVRQFQSLCESAFTFCLKKCPNQRGIFGRSLIKNRKFYFFFSEALTFLIFIL